LIPYAENICGGKGATLGHYKFETKEPLAPDAQHKPELVLRQRIRCGPPSPSGSPPSSVPRAAHDDKAIQQITYSYLALKDAGKYSNAYALFTDSMKASATLDSWSEAAKKFNAVAGLSNKRQIKKITWYDNPPSAPVPGTYAAVDYFSEFANLSFHCGYVVWLGTSDGSFRLVREEQNYIDNKSESKMSRDQVWAFRSRYGC
jgi:hypothetical protein